MPIKKLLDSAIFGLGATAGKRLFEEIEEKLVGKEEEAAAPKPETEKEKAAKAKLAAKEAKKAAEAKRKEKARIESEVDDELAALKKRLKK